MTNPWVTFRPPDPSREYLALVTRLPLLRFRDLFRFLNYSGQIQQQLKTTPGVVGYSVRAEILTKIFGTLSVWESEEALQAFVVKAPHLHVMEGLQGKMGKTSFHRWKIKGSECPLRWADALRRQRESAGAGAH